jgi:type IV pilus assembly protein PilZ
MPKPANRSGRRSPRLHHDLPVVYRSVGGFLSDWATDISQVGIFINSRSPLPVGTTVKVTVQIPGTTFPCVLTGRVARVVEWEAGAERDPGMGIEFTDVDRDKRARIEAFVDTMRGALEPG